MRLMIEWLAIGITSGAIGGAVTYAKHYGARKKETAEYLKAALREKDLLDQDLESLLEIKDKALLLVGSFGGADRSYSGDTLEMAKKTEALMQENFHRLEDLAERVDDVQRVILGDRDKVLSKADVGKVKWINERHLAPYKSFECIKIQGAEDMSVLLADLGYLENLLETLWGRLDEQDKRFKSILLRQVELVKRCDSGRFHLKSLSRSWMARTEILIDNAFSISKHDPVRVDKSLLGYLIQRFDKAEALLDVAEKLINIENNEVARLKERMDVMNIEELWIDDMLDNLATRLSALVDFSDSVQIIEAEIDSACFTECLYEIGILLKKYERHHRHVNEKFDHSLGKVRRQIAEHLDRDEEGVLKDSDILNEYKQDAQEVLSDFGEAIAKGNVARAQILNDLLKDKLAIVHDALATGRRSAIEGEDRVKSLRAELERAQKTVYRSLAKHEALLDSVSQEVFDEHYLKSVDGAQHQLDILEAQLDLIQRYREDGKFIITEKIMDSADVTLSDLNEIPVRVASSEREIHKMESKIVRMLERVEMRLSECSRYKEESYLCIETREMIDGAEASYASFLAMNKISGRSRNLLEILESCHQLDDLLEAVALCIVSDVDMFRILRQKVEQIDSLVKVAISNSNKAATDGIPDSGLTTKMLEKVDFLAQRWPTLKARIERYQQDWKELRFDFDVYLQGLEAVNLQLEDELKSAQKALSNLNEVSVELKKLSDWEGERGFRAETREANQILHQAFQKLSLGEYNEAISLAQETRDEMRDSLHHARGKERVAELRNARIQSRIKGSKGLSGIAG